MLYDIASEPNVILFATMTFLSPGAVIVLQRDGNLVMVDTAGGTPWNAGTSGTFTAVLHINDAGQIFLLDFASQGYMWLAGNGYPMGGSPELP